MVQESTTFTTIFRAKKCHFHYDMQKNIILFMHYLVEKIKYLILGFPQLVHFYIQAVS
jgi:hypothetical protein